MVTDVADRNGFLFARVPFGHVFDVIPDPGRGGLEGGRAARVNRGGYVGQRGTVGGLLQRQYVWSETAGDLFGQGVIISPLESAVQGVLDLSNPLVVEVMEDSGLNS